MVQQTRLGNYGGPRAPYGSFAGKVEAQQTRTPGLGVHGLARRPTPLTPANIPPTYELATVPGASQYAQQQNLPTTQGNTSNYQQPNHRATRTNPSGMNDARERRNWDLLSNSNILERWFDGLLTVTGGATGTYDSDTYIYTIDVTVASLDDVEDIVVTSPADGEILVYDSGTSTWINNTFTEAGVAPEVLTTKGDLYGFSTVNARIPVGANNKVLISDSTETLGVRWGNSYESSPSVEAEGDIGSGTTDIDWTAGDYHSLTLSADATLTFKNPSGPTFLVLEITQSNGPYIITWPATIREGIDIFFDTSVMGMNAVDVYIILFDGTTYLLVDIVSDIT